jgi:uncharacterized protein (DUF302 family)
VETLSAEETYTITEQFDRALKLVRSTLLDHELNISAEFDVTNRFAPESVNRPGPAKLLLVDNPLLLFEALALDRAAAVFVPLHVLVSADGDRTQVVCMDPAVLFDMRLPAGAAQPLERLRKRVTAALDSLVSTRVP